VVPDAPPLTGFCTCCGKKCKGDTHHFVYAYATKKVRKNPMLALENTTELCFPCHRVANALKLLHETKDEIAINLYKLQREQTRKRSDEV